MTKMYLTEILLRLTLAKATEIDVNSFMRTFKYFLEKNNVDVIHILSHGAPGRLVIGDVEYDENTFLNFFGVRNSAPFSNQEYTKSFLSSNRMEAAKEINF